MLRLVASSSRVAVWRLFLSTAVALCHSWNAGRRTGPSPSAQVQTQRWARDETGGFVLI